jgi:metallo-beta-lactamase family protein
VLLRFLGAAGTVTGSRLLVEQNGQRVLVDCCMLDGATAIKAHGRYVPVRARVLGLDEFSCHADADQLLRWLAAALASPRACFTVHGEPDAASALADRIHHDLGWCAVPARDGEKVRT